MRRTDVVFFPCRKKRLPEYRAPRAFIRVAAGWERAFSVGERDARRGRCCVGPRLRSRIGLHVAEVPERHREADERVHERDRRLRGAEGRQRACLRDQRVGHDQQKRQQHRVLAFEVAQEVEFLLAQHALADHEQRDACVHGDEGDEEPRLLEKLHDGQAAERDDGGRQKQGETASGILFGHRAFPFGTAEHASARRFRHDTGYGGERRSQCATSRGKRNNRKRDQAAASRLHYSTLA